MAVRVIDKETYLDLVDAFRELGATFNGVAKKTRLSRDMVRRAWLVGWPHRYEWARPIVSVISEDSAELRARLNDQLSDDVEIVRLARAGDRITRRAKKQAERKKDDEAKAAEARREAAQGDGPKPTGAEQDARRAEVEAQARREREELVRRRSEAETAEEAEREKARQQAVEARTQEAQLVRLSRGAAIGTLGGTMRLMPALAKLADQLRAAVDAGQIPVDKAAATINTIARTVREATVAAQVVIELERLHVGAPQAIIGVMQHEVALDEAAIAVEEFQAAIDRSRQLGIVQPTTISVGTQKGTP